MDFLFELAWKNIAVAGILALAATVAGRFFRRPAVAHGLWLLVLLKLVTPPLWQVPVPWPVSKAAEPSPDIGNSAENLEQDYAAAMAAAAMLVAIDPKRAENQSALQPVAGNSDTETGTPAPAEYRFVSGPPISNPEPSPASPSALRISWQQVTIGVWAVGSAAWLGLLHVRLRRFRRLAVLATSASEEARAALPSWPIASV